MERIGFEHDFSQWAAARVIVALEISFEHEMPVAHDHDTMKIPNVLLRDSLVEPCLEVGCEGGLAW
jgi:hypothetical protein